MQGSFSTLNDLVILIQFLFSWIMISVSKGRSHSTQADQVNVFKTSGVARMEQNFWDKRLTTSRGMLPRLFKKVLLRSIFSPFFFFFRLNGSRFGYATILLISKNFPGIFRSDDFTTGILVDESSRGFFNRYRI